MPTLCAICRETYGSCAACKRADALPMPEPERRVTFGTKTIAIYSEAQLRAARLEGARAAVEAMGKDAARYRWLRDCAPFGPKRRPVVWMTVSRDDDGPDEHETWLDCDELDDAVDAAMAKGSHD